MATDKYHGAAALSQSKYASPIQKARFASFSPAPVPAETALATKEQIAATNTEAAVMPAQDVNPDAQLALEQAENLKAKIKAHTSENDKLMATTVTSTRKLLILIREALGPDSEAIKATSDLWDELETIFKTTKAYKDTLPQFMEQQKDNMSLYHNSVVNEVIRDTQEELKLQHKKVGLQHSLILEHQQAYLNYKENTEAKLNECIELQERVSRLTLDKGLLKTELDNRTKASETLKANSDEAKETTEQLRSEIEDLLSSKKKLESENEALQKALAEFKQRTSTEHNADVDRSKEEISHLTDQLSKGAQKLSGLESLIKTLQTTSITKTKQYEALKLEYDSQQKKVTAQGSEFAKLREDHLSLAKQVALLNMDVSEHSAARKGLQEEVVTLKSNGAANVEKVNSANAQVKILNDKVKKLESLNDDLETELNDLAGKQAEMKKLKEALEVQKDQNDKLSATIFGLQKASKTVMTGSVDTAHYKQEVQRVQEKLQAAEQRAEKSLEKVKEWQTLATRSFNEYQVADKKAKAAEVKIQAAAEKDREIAKLKQELQAAKQTNGASALGSKDAAYWKEKYEAVVGEY